MAWRMEESMVSEFWCYLCMFFFMVSGHPFKCRWNISLVQQNTIRTHAHAECEWICFYIHHWHRLNFDGFDLMFEFNDNDFHTMVLENVLIKIAFVYSLLVILFAYFECLKWTWTKSRKENRNFEFIVELINTRLT